MSFVDCSKEMFIYSLWIFYLKIFIIIYSKRERERERLICDSFCHGYVVFYFSIWILIVQFLRANDFTCVHVVMNFFWPLAFTYKLHPVLSLLLSTMKWISSSSFFPQMSILLSDSNHIANFFLSNSHFRYKKRSNLLNLQILQSIDLYFMQEILLLFSEISSNRWIDGLVVDCYNK